MYIYIYMCVCVCVLNKGNTFRFKNKFRFLITSNSFETERFEYFLHFMLKNKKKEN